MSDQAKTECISANLIQRMLRVLVAGWMIVCLWGCGSSERSATPRSREQPQTELQQFMTGLRGYIDATGTVPASRQVLRDFCVASNLPWDKVDWSRFAWQQVGNGTVTIAYALDGRVIPISIVIPPPAPK